MKRTLVAAILGMAASVASSYGQGHIIFSNYTSTTYHPVTYSSDALTTALLPSLAGHPVTDSGVEAQLLFANGTFADTASFLAAATSGNSTFINPSFTFGGGGYYADPNDQLLTSATGPVTFMVEAWQTTGQYGGATFATSELRGQSGLWQETAAADANSNGIQPTSNPQKSFLIGPPAMSIAIVPEPATFTLVGLGAAAMFFRRRK